MKKVIFFLFISISICLSVLLHLWATNKVIPIASEKSHISSSASIAINALTGKPGRVDPICVASHLNGLSRDDVDRQLTLMQQTGIAWTRFDFNRSGVETAQGVYDWSQWDYIVNDATSKGIHVIALLDQWGVPTWEPYYQGPQTPDTTAGYSEFASAVARHYKGQIQLYELGNEENTSVFWPPSPNVSTYTQLLIAGYNNIKAVDPSAKVISGGLAPAQGSNIDPLIYLQQMYAHGAEGHFDYLGIHPYSQPNSPDVVSQSSSAMTFNIVSRLKSLMEKEGDQNKQIMVTEIGWPSYSEGVTQSSQSAYISRVYTKIMHENYQYVALACIYDFVNDGTDTTNDQDNFGVLNQNYTPKPAYTAVRNAASDFAANFTAIAP
jgi:hypothetical protein